MQKNKLNFTDYILLTIVFAIVYWITIHGNLSSMDEIWTFQFARRILYHQVPYRDYFMIISPLKAQIDMVLLKLFSDQLIILRWFALFLAYLQGFLLYRISIKLGLDRNSALLVLFIFFLTFLIFPINNYNWFSLLLIVILLFPLNSPINKKNAFSIGVLISLLVLTKQNIGIYLIAGVSFFYFVTRNKYYLFSFLGFFLVFLPEVIYFWFKGSLSAFLEIFYANWIPFFNAHFRNRPIKTFLYSFILLLLILLVYYLIHHLQNDLKKRNIIPLVIVCLIVLGYSFPIFDIVHFIFLLPFLCLLIQLKWNLKKTRPFLYFFFFLQFLMGYSFYLFVPSTTTTNLPHLKMIPISKDYAKTILEVANYLKEQRTMGSNPYEIDYATALFDVTLDQLGFKYDSMQKGNFGLNGENEYIEMLKNDLKAVAIFDERKQKTKITEYVLNNMTYKETIAKTFRVYAYDK